MIYSNQRFMESNGDYKKRRAAEHNEAYEQAKLDAIEAKKPFNRMVRTVKGRSKGVISAILGAALAVGN